MSFSTQKNRISTRWLAFFLIALVTFAVYSNIYDSAFVYDDFLRELHLPYKLSASGPAMAKGDVNSDGLEDIFIGSSAGYISQIYFQISDGKFRKSTQTAFTKHRKCLDGGAAFIDIDNDNDLDLYVSSGGNISTENSTEYMDRLYLNNGAGIFTSLPACRRAG